VATVPTTTRPPGAAQDIAAADRAPGDAQIVPLTPRNATGLGADPAQAGD